MYTYVKITKCKRKTLGHGKELITGTKNVSGIEVNTYSFSDDRFEREPKWTYTITLHESKRVGNGIKTKQAVVASVNYYDIAEYIEPEEFYLDLLQKLDEAALKIKGEKLSDEEQEELYEEFGEKVHFIFDIFEEFKETEEYKVHKRHVDILNEYKNRKEDFLRNNDCFDTEYDVCYDVYGHLTNLHYLQQIKKRSEKHYYEPNNRRSSIYSSDDRKILKGIYRTLCKSYHPDNNPNKNTDKEIQMINKLRDEWGL